jgi:23S rRNA (guanosine2251-2'-O)-methyltransferase
MSNIIFGIRPVIEAIEAGREIDKVLIKKGADSENLVRLKEMCNRRKISVQEVPVEKLNRMVKMPHQGVIAQMAMISYREISDIMDELHEKGRTPLIVICDGITDVRNFGAIARSAECAGADAIIIATKNGAQINADAMKTSAGALNILPVCRVGSMRNTLKWLQNEGVELIAASEKSSRLIYEVDLKRPIALILGSEDKGVSNEILKMCDHRVAIPMNGTIESLNVSAAAAVIMFEVVRQRTNI